MKYKVGDVAYICMQQSDNRMSDKKIIVVLGNGEAVEVKKVSTGMSGIPVHASAHAFFDVPQKVPQSSPKTCNFMLNFACLNKKKKASKR